MSAMAQNEKTIDGLDRACCDSLFRCEMVLGKNEYLYSNQDEKKV